MNEKTELRVSILTGKEDVLSFVFFDFPFSTRKQIDILNFFQQKKRFQKSGKFFFFQASQITKRKVPREKNMLFKT